MSPQELWDQGTPISVAGLVFAPPDLQKRYLKPRLPRKMPLGSGVQQLISSLQINEVQASEFENNAIKLSQIFGRIRKQSNAWTEIEESLIDRVKRGELVAVGYEKSSKVNSKPIVIPTRFFERRFLKLSKDLISADHYEFKFVRICQFPKDRKLAIVIKRGRPAMDADIIQAMISLAETQGISFRDGPQKSYVGAIQERIKETNPNSRKPSERTIKRIMPKGLGAISRFKANKIV